MNEYRIVSTIDRRRWADFVWHHPHGNIFQTPEMFDVFQTAKNNRPFLTAVTDMAGEILGILVAVIHMEYGGILGKFTSRAIIWGGPLILDDNEAVLDIILEAYNRAIGKKAIYTQFRNLWEPGPVFKTCFAAKGFSYEDHLNILVNIAGSEEMLWKNVHGKRRNEIRRAHKEGTSVMELDGEQAWAESYDILAQVYRQARLPLYDRSVFAAIFEKLHAKGMIRFFGAVNRNKLIGVIVVLCYKDRIYDWYAGSYKEYYHQYPNDLLPWEVFLWGKKKGYKIFDFGGAGKPGKCYGVRDYKKKFGGQFVCFGRYEKIHKPVLMKLGKLGFKLWQKLR